MEGKAKTAQQRIPFPSRPPLLTSKPKVENGRMCVFRSKLRIAELIQCNIPTILRRTKTHVPGGARKYGLCDFRDSAYEFDAFTFARSTKNKSGLR